MNSKTANFFSTFKNLPHTFLKLIFPDMGLCYICGQEGDVVCEKCASQMERHAGRLCEKCGRSITHNKEICCMCEKNERPYDKGAIALFYEGAAKHAMKQYKFENMLPYSNFFAKEIHKSIEKFEDEIDIITAVPSHYFKVTGKGYNPPALIAKKLSKRLGISYKANIIKRVRYTKSMSLLKGVNRMEHSRKNFEIQKNNFYDKNILIVDDVSTTGATLHVCSDILKKSGAKKVFVAAVCGDNSSK